MFLCCLIWGRNDAKKYLFFPNCWLKIPNWKILKNCKILKTQARNSVQTWFFMKIFNLLFVVKKKNCLYCLLNKIQCTEIELYCDWSTYCMLQIFPISRVYTLIFPIRRTSLSFQKHWWQQDFAHGMSFRSLVFSANSLPDSTLHGVEAVSRHFDRHDILYDLQHGFHERRLCKTQSNW